MAFEIELTPDATLLTLSGDITIANNAELRSALNSAPSTLDLVISASEVIYIDSSGVACLIMAYKKLRQAGAKVRLVSPSIALLNVLATLKFDSLFVIEK